MSTPKPEAEQKAADLANYREWRRLQDANPFVAAEHLMANLVSIERGKELDKGQPSTGPEAA